MRGSSCMLSILFSMICRMDVRRSDVISPLNESRMLFRSILSYMSKTSTMSESRVMGVKILNYLNPNQLLPALTKQSAMLFQQTKSEQVQSDFTAGWSQIRATFKRVAIRVTVQTGSAVKHRA